VELYIPSRFEARGKVRNRVKRRVRSGLELQELARQQKPIYAGPWTTSLLRKH
jgi:hypothetical protein